MESKAVRVLQLIHKPQRRGAEIFASQLGNRLRRDGHVVHRVFLYPYEKVGHLPLDKNDLVLAGEETNFLEKFAGWHPGLLNRLLEAIHEFRPDVVQANGSRTVKYGALARLREKAARWVLIYRNIGDPSAWGRRWWHQIFYQKLVIPWIDGVVAVSQATLEKLKSLYSFQASMVTIPNGVEDGAFVPAMSREAIRRNLDTPLSAPVILFVGSLTPEKRVDRLLRVVRTALVRIPELRLWIVGEGPLGRELEKQATLLTAENSVRFLGVQESVATFMHAADLLVLTSDTEGAPGVILEAGFMGLPVVTTRVGGGPECVVDGKTGILVPPEDESTFADEMIGLLKDPTRLRTMSAASNKWIREHFLMSQIVRRYVEFYRQVLVAKTWESRKK